MRILAALTCVIRNRTNTVIIPAAPTMFVAILYDRDIGSSHESTSMTIPPATSSVIMNSIIALSCILLSCLCSATVFGLDRNLYYGIIILDI